ncbi:MAG: PDDEXK nuclease domain-containing protein [Planctomycetaceae bacterium]|jgi:predicted nuclease of restriction endonuclease-like (RecB) superfamily|nr:PDDEXK nuclease domain-containing protein [Planctomycetaceae bacterium]
MKNKKEKKSGNITNDLDKKRIPIKDKQYREWLNDLKQRIRQTQIKAAVRVNNALIELYWNLGAEIVAKQAESVWGSGIIKQLSADLRAEFPNIQGFSETNLRTIKRFYLFYSQDNTIQHQLGVELESAKQHQLGVELESTIQHQAGVELYPVKQQQLNAKTKQRQSADGTKHKLDAKAIQHQAGVELYPVNQQQLNAKTKQRQSADGTKHKLDADAIQHQAGVELYPVNQQQLNTKTNLYQSGAVLYSEKLPQFIGEVPWRHHTEIITKCKSIDEAMFYLRKTVQEGWSRSVLLHHLDANLYKTQGKAVTNFHNTLPDLQCDLAKEILKEPYCFDFLALTAGYKERELEDALTQNITKFLLELGKGFAFVGRQVEIEVGNSSFFVDMLFYHIRLKCFVVVELKTGNFEPEFAGKLNFYVTAIDRQMKGKDDNATIGLLICKTKDDVIVEYSLSDIHKPVGVSSFELSKILPIEFQSSLPSIEEIEAELENIE